MVKLDDVARLAVAARRLLITQARVLSAEMVSASLREITLTAPEFAQWRCEPGCSVRLALGRLGVDVQRTYSVWRHDPASASLVLRAHLAADGPGTQWAGTARKDQTVWLRGPRGRFAIDPNAAWHLFAGEETGAVPLLAMRASLPSGAIAVGALEAAGCEHRMPDDTLPWVDRGDASAVASPVLLAAVRDLPLPAGPGTAYLAGERDTCVALRRYLILDRGWPRHRVRTSIHWAQGKRGLE